MDIHFSENGNFNLNNLLLQVLMKLIRIIMMMMTIMIKIILLFMKGMLHSHFQSFKTGKDCTRDCFLKCIQFGIKFYSYNVKKTLKYSTCSCAYDLTNMAWVNSHIRLRNFHSGCIYGEKTTRFIKFSLFSKLAASRDLNEKCMPVNNEKKKTAAGKKKLKNRSSGLEWFFPWAGSLLKKCNWERWFFF